MTGLQVDREVVARRLTGLLDAVAVLREFQTLTLEELAESPKVYWAVQHGLQLCTQSVLDVAAHLASALETPVRDEYRDHILALGRLGILTKDFAKRIAPMAWFRNILVHAYLEVDPHEVYRVLKFHLDHFVHFASEVQGYLDGLLPPTEHST